jgi:hypothetical protein
MAALFNGGYMRKIFVPIFALGLLGCGVSTSEMRALEFKSYPIKQSEDHAKQCLLDKLNSFRPDRMLINEYGKHTEIFIGATQAGKFRSFYLFDVLHNEIKMSHYDGVFPALSKSEADSIVTSCL